MAFVSSRVGALPTETRAAVARRQRVLMFAGAAALAASLALAPITQARAMPESFADLAKEVSPAVVTITVTQSQDTAPSNRPQGAPENPEDGPFKDFFERFDDQPQAPGPQGQARGMGSGFILDIDGYVVTNNHVVAGADEIVVTTKDGDDFQAELIGRDQKSDLALLKIESDETLPYVEFGDSDKVRVGDWVMAVGNPFGLGGTVTAGIVSARGRELSGGTLIDFLQIDAAINRGNSGGPAFDRSGDVIGVNAAIFSPNGGNVGIGFAIPSNLAKTIIADLRDDGQVDRGWLGVRIQPVTSDIAEGFGLDDDKGALVASVGPDSPAAAAGLKSGDIILSWDKKVIDSFGDLPRFVAATPQGKTVDVEIWRGEAQKTVSVVTGELKPEQAAALESPAKAVMPGVTEVPETGLAVANLNKELRERFGVEEDRVGVVIVAVDPASQAAEVGFRPGDVVESIALESVPSADAMVAKVEALRSGGETVAMIQINRQGSASFHALRIGEA